MGPRGLALCPHKRCLGFFFLFCLHYAKHLTGTVCDYSSKHVNIQKYNKITERDEQVADSDDRLLGVNIIKRPRCSGGKYIYSSTALKYNFEVFVLYLSISLFCYFILLLNYISEANIVLFTPLHLFDNFSYSLLCRFRLMIQNIINK